MLHSSLIRPGRMALAALLCLPALAAASASGRAPGARPGVMAPSRLAPQALAAWKWRQSMDARPAQPGMAGLMRSAASSEDAGENLVNDTTGIRGTSQSQIRVVSQPGQNILVVWREGRRGDGDIRAQLLDKDGNPIILKARPVDNAGFLVNDDPSGANQSRPEAAMNRHGEFVIVWEDGRNGGTDIYMQRFHADGSSDTGNIKVNVGRDDETRFAHTRPSVSMDDQGNVAAAWVDDRQADVILSTVITDIYAQRFHPDGSYNGSSFLVSAPVRSPDGTQRTSNNNSPAVAFTGLPGDSSFIIAWQAVSQEGRGGRRGIFARRLINFQARLGTPLDTVIASVDDGAASGRFDPVASSNPVILAPALSATGDTNNVFTIAWVDSSGGLGAVKARRLHMGPWLRGFEPLPEPSQYISDADGSPILEPGMVRYSDGQVGLSWIQAGSDPGVTTARLRTVNADLPGGGDNITLNSSAAAHPRSSLSVASLGATPQPGQVLAAWEEAKSAQDNDVVLRFVGVGASSDSSIGVDGQPDQINPNLSANGAGNAVAVWTDFRAGLSDPDIFGQRLNPAGQPVGANFKVNTDAAGGWQDHARVFVDAQGAFTVVWEDARNNSFQVYGRRFGQDGAPAGVEFAISPTDTLQQFRPSLAGTPSGKVLVAWEDNRRGFLISEFHATDIYVKPIDSSGPLGNAVRVSPFVGDSSATSGVQALNAAPKLDPAVVVDANGNGLVFWTITAPDSTRNRDVDGRYIRSFTSLPGMVDAQYRPITSQAFSVADTLGSGFLFPQQRAQAAYVGGNAYVVAFEDERYGTTSREDVRARLVLARSVNADTVQVFLNNESFMCNDDTVPLPPDFAGNIAYLSASQYQPAVAANPVDSTFTVMWSDFRTKGNYNLVRQSYRYIPAEDPETPAGLRLLGRNTFVNSDTQIQEAAHGYGSLAYSGAGQLLAIWQATRGGKRDWDVYSRVVTQQPDTCLRADCKFPAPRVQLQAVLVGAGAVSVRWSVPASQAGGEVRLFRYDVAAYASNPATRPEMLGAFPAETGTRVVSDNLPGNAAGYAYELTRGGEVLASAVPAAAAVTPVVFSMKLGQPGPNPARGLTHVQFSVPGRPSDRVGVSLRLYDVSGRLVKSLVSDTRAPGEYSADWRGENEAGSRASTGVYFLRMDSGSQAAVRKIMWLH